MTDPHPIADARTLIVRVPIAIRRHGGRKLVLAPNGADVTTAPLARHIDNAIVKAIARGFRWNTMLETGEYATVQDLANAEKINPSYVSRVLRLPLLAPATVEAILDGRANEGPTLAEAMAPFPVEWSKQAGILSTHSLPPCADRSWP